MPEGRDLHEPLDRDDDAVEASPRSFGFVFAGVFTVVGLLPLWGGEPVRPWSLALAAAFAACAGVAPAWLSPLNRAWLRVGLLLHRVVNPLVMAALFYLAITPFGLVMRLMGRGASRQMAPDPAASTYWRSRADSPPSGMRNQF
jgi:hypothetical protein